MRRWTMLGVLAVVAACRPAPPPELMVEYDPCGQRALERDPAVSFGPVRACAPPSGAELAMACRIAEGLAINPDPQPGDPPSPMVEVRAARCELTDAEQGKARCRFEQSVEGGAWRPAEAALTRTYWSHLDELVFARGISWYADGRCG